MSRNCKNSSDSFCYICGDVTLKQYKRRLTARVKKLYESYFGCKLGDQDKKWAPHIGCVKCTSSLSTWAKGTGRGLKFAIPMVWREPKDHCTDCYFCLTDITGIVFVILHCVFNMILKIDEMFKMCLSLAILIGMSCLWQELRIVKD